MFGRKAKFLCPRCMRDIKIPEKDSNRDYECPACKYVMPIAYIKGFDERNPNEYALPLFMQVFGWTKHGKTLFLDVLKIQLIIAKYNYAYLQWSGYSHRSLTQLDDLKERQLRVEVDKGLLPGSTQKRDRDQNEVYITKHINLPRWGNRTLVIMDHAGERFENRDIPTEEIPFLIKTPTTFMIISLDDLLTNNQGETMDQLLNFYITAMEYNQVDFMRQRRKLVFVFTKADKLTHLPPNLHHYLASDTISSHTSSPYLTGMNLLNHLERMYRVSNEIEAWLKTDPTNQQLGSLGMLGLIRNKNIEARYTIISALGKDISQDHSAAVEINPKRVLDPFFWALEFQSRDQ